MGVRGVPDLLNDADTPKTNIISFTGKVLHVDFMGTYFAYFRALYFVFLCKEAVRIASESAIARTLNQWGGDIVDFINSLNCAGQQRHQLDERFEFIAKALNNKFVKAGFDQKNTIFHCDGGRAREKQREYARRQARNNTAMNDLNKFFPAD
ncbi:hypothetical protein BGX28_001556, partial [Mortierella sp. GBA30]